MILDNHRCKGSARKTVRNEAQPCVIVARTLRAGECLTSDGCLNLRSTSRFALTASAPREHVASPFVWNSFSKRQLITEQKNGGRSQRKGKVVLVKRGGPSFFFFVKSYSFSVPNLSHNTTELTCVALSAPPVWMSGWVLRAAESDRLNWSWCLLPFSWYRATTPSRVKISSFVLRLISDVKDDIWRSPPPNP